MNKKLTNKQKAFCEEYLIDKNATQAVIRAGYSKKTAKEIGYENLTKPHIKEYITNLIKEQSMRTLITADRVLEEVARLAFAKLSDVTGWNDDGISLKDSESLKDDVLAAVSEVSQTVLTTEKSKATTTKIKMHNKAAALDKLMKHLKLYEDSNVFNGSVTIVNDVPRNK